MSIIIGKEQKTFLESVDRQLSINTRQKYSKALGKFLMWVDEEGLKLRQIKYTDMLIFVRHIKKQSLTADGVNRVIHVLRQYFIIKVKEGLLKKNPVIGIKVRGAVKRIPHDLLDRTELDKLYERYPDHSIADKRSRVMLGLLVFQGLTSGDLQRLEVSHIKVNEGKIYVPGSPVYVHRGGIKSRVLELKANQLLEMQIYLREIRPGMLKEKTNKLFVSGKGNKNIQNKIFGLSQKLRKYERSYRNVDQIRASVITDWLKEKDVRIVQYMAGHKKVKSTEHYKAARLEDLEQALNQYHPLG